MPDHNASQQDTHEFEWSEGPIAPIVCRVVGESLYIVEDGPTRPSPISSTSAARAACEALATGRLRYPSAATPSVAVIELLRLVRMCVEAIDRFRRQHPAAVTGERIAPGAVGVFNRLALDRGAAQAGVNRFDILLAGSAVRYLAASLPNDPDPRPLGQRVLQLFSQCDADVCIDGEILALANDLENTLGAVVKAESEFRANCLANRPSDGSPDVCQQPPRPRLSDQNQNVGRLNTRSKDGQAAVDRILEELLNEQPDLIDRKTQLWKTVASRPETAGIAYNFVMRRPPVQKALAEAARRLQRRLQVRLPQHVLDAFADEDVTEDTIARLVEEHSTLEI